MADRIQCPSCGAELPATARYCRMCGRSLAGDDAPRTGFESIALLETRLNDLQREVEVIQNRLYRLEDGVARRTELPTAPRAARPAPAVTPAHRPVVKPVVPAAQPAIPAPPPAMPAPAFAARAKPIAAPERPERHEWGAAPPPPRPAKPPRDWEQFLSGQGMAIVGGLAIVVGAIFFLSVAFSRGWIGPELRCAIGVVAAVAFIATGWRQFTRQLPVIAHALTAVGMGVMMLSLFAATRLYDLIPIELGLLGSLLTATVAAVIAIRVNSQVVAGYGIVTALAAPPILGADPTGTTIAFIAVALVGTTLVALNRTWPWLPHLAFALSLPQLAAWMVDEPAAGVGALALGGFWLLHALAAGGEEFKRPTDRPRLSSAVLLAADTVSIVGLAYVLFADKDVRDWLGPFLFALAAAHLVLGVQFLFARGDRHPFGMLATAGGLATLMLAISEQFNGIAVALGWVVVAVVVAAFAGRLRNPYGAGAGAVVGAFVLGHIWTVEYPLTALGGAGTPDRPFLHANWLTVMAVLAALAFAGWVGRLRELRVGLLVVGTALLVTTVPHELSGTSLLVAWTVLLVLGTLVGRHESIFGEARFSPAYVAGTDLSFDRLGAWLPALSGLILAFGHAWVVEYPLGDLGRDRERTPPFLHAEGFAVALLLLAMAFAGWRPRSRGPRVGLLLAGATLIATVLPHELTGMALLAAWGTLIVLGAAVERYQALLGAAVQNPVIDRVGPWLPWLGATALAIGHLLVVEAPLDDILTGTWSRPDQPFLDAATAAAAIVAGASLLAIAIMRTVLLRRTGALVVITVLAYLMPFQLAAAGAVAAWAALGSIAYALSRWDEGGRHAYWSALVTLLGGGFIWTLIAIAPPERLAVDAGPMADTLPLWSGATLALGALALALLAYLRQEYEPRRHHIAGILAAATGVYLLSVGLVDQFQQQVGGDIGLDSLQKRAQVGLSVLWAVIGGITFAVGALRDRKPIRLGGLALLGLATGKVFVIDLASLNASYRVPSFIALGLLLLGSSYIYQRHRARALSRRDDEADDDGHPRGSGPAAGDTRPPLGGTASGAPA